jgi:hypothetical protein
MCEMNLIFRHTGSGALTKRRQPSIDPSNDNITKVVGIAIGIGCAQSSNGDASKLGHDIRVAAEAAIGGEIRP